MKKLVWLSSVILLLFLAGSCCKPCKEENAKLTAQIDSLRSANAMYTDETALAMAPAPKKPHKIAFKWKHNKTYRFCYTASIKPTYVLVTIYIHRKNNTEIIRIIPSNPTTGVAQSAYLNTIVLSFDAYISVQGTDSHGNVTDFDINGGADLCAPTQTQRENVSATDGSGSTVAVTIDEL